MWAHAVATFLCLFVQFAYLPNINAWRSFTINLSNASSTVYSDKYNINVSVIKNALNIHCEFIEEVTHPVASVEIYLQSPDGRYNLEVMNRTIDVCTFLTNKLYEPLIQIFYRILQQYGELPDRCPLQPKTYDFENVIFDPEHFPLYLPERRGYCQLKILKKENRSLISSFQIDLFFEIKSEAMKRLKANKNL